MNFVRQHWSGILLCIGIAVPAWFLGNLFPVIGGPVFSILIGMILTLIIKDKGSMRPGIAFTSKKILQYAVILLGFGMNLTDILAKGRQSLPIIISTISTSLIVSFLLYKLLHMDAKVSTLIGVGSSICGGSAIAATAPVIEADDEEIAQSISVIFLFNVIAALVFPALGSMLHLSNEGFGLFAGTAVNDTSSVTATASAWDGIHGSNTLNAATIVKLTRTLAIIPITLALAIYRAGKKEEALEEHGAKFSLKQVFPMFVLFFILASVITTVFSLPAAVTDPLKTLSKFFIVMAMAAIGLNTHIVKLVKTGGKPIFMGFCCWVAIAAVSLVIQSFIGIL
nr:YeiH family protein [uncultured Anaerostipes sp.]